MFRDDGACFVAAKIVEGCLWECKHLIACLEAMPSYTYAHVTWVNWNTLYAAQSPGRRTREPAATITFVIDLACHAAGVLCNRVWWWHWYWRIKVGAIWELHHDTMWLLSICTCILYQRCPANVLQVAEHCLPLSMLSRITLVIQDVLLDLSSSLT